MAFIRSHMLSARAGIRSYQGDPLFGIKLPKIRLPKIQLKKLVGPALTAASFLPTPVGGVLRLGKLAKLGLGAKKLLTSGAKLGAAGAAFGAGGQLAQQLMGPATPGAGFAAGEVSPEDFARSLTGQAPRSGRRYRRMNVTNMRALTRAVRRVKKFEKIARQCITTSKHVRCKPRSRGRKCA